MKIPYNQVHTRGQILFAARGGRIHTFSLTDGHHIASWKHPDVDKVDNVIKANAVAKLEADLSQEVEATEIGGPPAKRQKIDGDKEKIPATLPTSEVAPTSIQEGSTRSKHVEGRGKKGKRGKESANDSGRGLRYARIPDRPVITHLVSSEDSSHMLAITGHDKVIWVFEHDGNGNIKELSRRTMPKRPSSVAIAPDSWIVCADKFGDVYSLPLLMSEDNKPSTPASSLPLPTKKAFKPSANTLTVHSKGNRKALLNQILQAEQDGSSKIEPNNKTEGPNFELNLLLGHVSMLTSLTLGEIRGRKYIVTADRDEHIRVSRYMPNAHIIENFCFGHKEFISDMVIPTTRPDILISGGGDERLFVWDWVTGTLLSTANILSLAHEIMPELTKVAVSHLYTFVHSSENGAITYVLAICEDIKAIFSWQLHDNNELHHPSIIQLPGKPLSLAVSFSAGGNVPSLITALDPSTESKARSLHVFSLAINDGRLAVDIEASIKDDALEADETGISEEDVRSLLYNIESLRKLAGSGDDGEVGSESQTVNNEADSIVEASNTEE